MHTLKLTPDRQPVGVVLPREMLARLGVEKGDTLFVSEAPDGLRLGAHRPEFEAQMKAARDVMKKRRAVLKELAEMSRWVWLREDVLYAVHDAQLAEHGGLSGVRDANLFASALARPQHLAALHADVAELAAAYGYGIARNHPFIDGNKRTAFVAVELFLLQNDHELVADDVACVVTMLAVAAGEIEESTFAGWIRRHITRIASWPG